MKNKKAHLNESLNEPLNEFHGAEAIVRIGKKIGENVVKKRVKKGYRIKELDESIRKYRTKREVKILEKLNAITINTISPKITKTKITNAKFTPKLISQSDYELIMEHLPGKHLDKIITKENYKKIAADLGSKIKYLHDNSIMHGDLTTANILVDDNLDICIIDFGLSFFSNKVEHKAVDIHVLKEVIESSFDFGHDFMKILLKSYDESSVEKRLKEVEKRGRNKNK